MSKKDMLLLAIDHGNGYIKAKSKHKTIVEPSYYANKSDFDGRSFGKKKEIKFFHSVTRKSEEINDVYHAWGKSVHEAKGATFRSAGIGGSGRYLLESYLNLSEYIMSDLAPKTNRTIDVFVTTGCPANEIAYSGTIEELKNAYLGIHTVRIMDLDGKEYEVTLNVREVVVNEQPLGTVFYLYLDEEGYVRDEDIEDEVIATMDIGSGTSDGSICDSLTIQDDLTISIPYGMHYAYDKIAAAINREKNRSVATATEVEYQLTHAKSEKESNEFNISKLDGGVDITKYKEEAFRELSQIIYEQFSAKWSNVKIDRYVVSGGGALALKKYIDKWKEKVTVLDKEGQTANMEGFYRFGLYLQNADSEELQEEEVK